MAGKKTADDEPEDLLSLSQLMRRLDGGPEPASEVEPVYSTAPVLESEPLPKIMRMPAGIEVTERNVGHAVGHWVLQIRCDCGRRWFEIEPVQTADCPRCGALVFIDIEPR
jgi:hypothetical protein